MLFGNCLISYALSKCLCSFCTEIDKVSSLAHSPQLVFLTAIMPATVQLGLFLDLLFFWLGPADPTHCSCSSSLLAAYKYKPNESAAIYILVISS